MKFNGKIFNLILEDITKLSAVKQKHFQLKVIVY